MELNPRSDAGANRAARAAGVALLASIALGLLVALTLAPGIDVNLTADIGGTAANMAQAGPSLLGLGWLRLAVFALEVLFYTGLWIALKDRIPLISGWAAIIGIASAILGTVGSLIAMNAAQIAVDGAYSDAGRLELLALQATLDYTSFHLALVLGCVAKAAFFASMFALHSVPRAVSAFAVFASLFVMTGVIGRDFIDMLGNDMVTAAFLASNVMALLLIGGFLAWRGVKS